MLKKEWQGLWKNKFMLIVLVAIITIPTIYTNIFLGSMWDPYGEVDHLPVAVVNNDVAADYDGKTMEVGKELVDKLREENALDFNFVSADQAEEGIKNGTFYMVITIPEDFSYNATTLMDENPKTMELEYRTNPGTNYIASKMSETAVNKIRTSITEKVSRQYAETLFEQLGTINDGFKDASDATETLDDGANKLKDGSTTLAENLETLKESTLTFKEGTEKFNVSLGTYTSSVSTVNDGANQLKDGASKLNDGVTTYTGAVSQLNAGTNTLASYNKALNNGVGTLSNGLTTLKAGTSKALAGAQLMSDTIGEGLTGPMAVKLSTELLPGLQEANRQMKVADTLLQAVDTDNIGALTTGLTNGITSIVTNTTKSENAITGIASDIDTVVSNIEKSAGFSKLTTEEQNAILDEVKGIKDSENYNTALDTTGVVKKTATTVGSQLTGAGFDKLSNLGSLKAGVHLLVGKDDTNVFLQSENAINTLTGKLKEIKENLDRQGDTPTTMGLIQAMTAVNDGATLLENGVNDETEGLKTKVQTYTGSVDTVNSNLGKLNANSATLIEGLGTLQGGLTTLADGTAQLTANNSKLMDASNTIDTTVGKLVDASGKLSDGANTLEESMGTLTDGTKELHDTIADSSAELDEKLEPTGDKTYDMMSTPVETSHTEETSVDNNGNAMAAYMMSVGLWVGCLAFSIMFSLDQPAGKVTSGIRWWFSKASVGGLIAVTQPVVMVFALKNILGFNPASISKTILIAECASIAFMSLFYLFNVLMGKVGSFLLLVFMVLQLGGSAGTYPIELSNGFYQAINPYMPFTYSVNAFRSTIASGLSLTSAIQVFSGIFVVATALTIGVFEIKARRVKAQEAVMDAEAVLE